MRFIITAFLSLGFMGTAWAGQANIPNTFTSGTPAVAAQVNANFAASKVAIDDNYSRIIAIQLTPGPQVLLVVSPNRIFDLHH